MYTVILYYHFVRINQVERFIADHRRQCKLLNLLGRIYVSEEGINGTLGGKPEDVQLYMDWLQSLPGFEEIKFKRDTCDYVPFRKLIVRFRRELATLKPSIPIDLTKEKGRHLSPQEWLNILESDDQYELIDVRNDYEWQIGHFDGATLPPVENFYDTEKWIEQANIPKDKKILMYCTGGIRCEKFSVLMEKKGYSNVFQLDGGIINYAQQTGGKHFKGKCFVFDDRLAVDIEKNQQEPLGRCKITGIPTDDYINCANPDCNKLFLCSSKGLEEKQGCCSDECMKSERKRPISPKDPYSPTLRWYEYFERQPNGDLIKMKKTEEINVRQNQKT